MSLHALAATLCEPIAILQIRCIHTHNAEQKGGAMKRSILILATAVVLLGGCASTVKKSDESMPVPAGVKATGKTVVLNMTGSTVATTAKDWADFKGVWREKCTEEFANAGALFSMQ